MQCTFAHLTEPNQQKVTVKNELKRSVIAGIPCPFAACEVTFSKKHNVTSQAAIDKLLAKITNINCPYCNQNFISMHRCEDHIAYNCTKNSKKMHTLYISCYNIFKVLHLVI